MFSFTTFAAQTRPPTVISSYFFCRNNCVSPKKTKLRAVRHVGHMLPVKTGQKTQSEVHVKMRKDVSSGRAPIKTNVCFTPETQTSPSIRHSSRLPLSAALPPLCESHVATCFSAPVPRTKVAERGMMEVEAQFLFFFFLCSL